MLENNVIIFPADGRIRCRFWEDESVVYNQHTGETHLIEGIGTEIFRWVSKNNATSMELLQNIENIYDFPIDVDARTILNNLITEYSKLGLLVVMENRTQ